MELAKSAVDEDQICNESEAIIKAISELSLATTTAVAEAETRPHSVDKLRQLVLSGKRPMMYVEACKVSKLDGAAEVCSRLEASVQTIRGLVESKALELKDKEFVNHLDDAWRDDPGATLRLCNKDAPAAMKCFWKTWIQGQVLCVVSGCQIQYRETRLDKTSDLGQACCAALSFRRSPHPTDCSLILLGLCFNMDMRPTLLPRLAVRLPRPWKAF